MHIRADLAKTQAEVGLHHFPVNPHRRAAAGDAQVAQACLIKTVVADRPHPLQQGWSQPLAPGRGGMAARRVDQGDILIAYPQPVEIVEKFEAEAMPAP